MRYIRIYSFRSSLSSPDKILSCNLLVTPQVKSGRVEVGAAGSLEVGGYDQS